MGSGEGLSGCHACIKYLMFAFNFIFWLIGCALVGVGIWVMVDEGFKELAKENNYAFLQYAGIGLIVIGSIVMIVGFFGCCGAIRESQCLLVMFFICMLLLFLTLIAAGIVCLLYKDEVISKATEEFKQQIKEYNENQQFINFVQSYFECCGADGPQDYATYIIANLGGEKPDTCINPDTKLPRTQGCSEAVQEKLQAHIAVAAGIALGAGALMLLGMIFSMLLCCAIRDMEP